jgi:ABC-type branched-subunit amino acid transport system ATPase component/ABC-type branched-subunit amino acid transport system permease subunit
MTMIRLLAHPVLVFAYILALLPAVVHAIGQTVSLATEIVTFILTAMGFNLLLGYTGLVSFGHGAYFGLPAYVAALMQVRLGAGIVPAMLSGALAAVVLGTVIGYLVLRRRGVYFALLTLAFSQMFFAIVFRWTAVTGGENGLGGLQRPPVRIGDLTIPLSNQLVYYAIVAALTVLAVAFLWRLVESPFGRVLQAIRENELRARYLGYDTGQYKLIAFILSALLTGVAGVLYAFLIYFVYPQLVHVTMSGEIVAMAVVGGMRAFFGPALGATFFVLLRQILSGYTEHWLVVFGALFVFVVLFSPEGFAGVISRILPARPRPPIRRPLWEPTSSPDRTDPDPLVTPGEPVLVAKGLVKRFGALAAVDNVDLTVVRGRLHAIIGPNGAGKTTLFNLLTGLFPPDAGSIFLNGKEITGLPPERITRLGVSRSFQIVSIFQELTVFENVRIATQARSRHRLSVLARADDLLDVNAECARIIHLVGLAGKEDKVASSLPHADQRLLEIGIALATRPTVLLLDEPLAGLPPEERQRIAELIKKLSREVTIVLIDHDIDHVMALSDVITVMHQGRVIAEGTPDEIQRNKEVQQAYLGEIRVDGRTPPPRVEREPWVVVEGIHAFYGKAHVLHGVSLTLSRGEVACLLGRNGAGKTTTLRSIMGIVPPRSGRVVFGGREITGWPPEDIARLGIGLVPEGRRIFPNLTVEENLRIAWRNGRGRWDLENIYRHFPKLAEIRHRRGEFLSGGERQMLAIARALMGNPSLLLLDEPFEGLAPMVVSDIVRIIQEIRGDVTMLLVEQNATLALGLADYAYIIGTGVIQYAGLPGELLARHDLLARLLGVTMSTGRGQ